MDTEHKERWLTKFLVKNFCESLSFLWAVDKNPGGFLEPGRVNSPGSYWPGPGWIWKTWSNILIYFMQTNKILFWPWDKFYFSHSVSGILLLRNHKIHLSQTWFAIFCWLLTDLIFTLLYLLGSSRVILIIPTPQRALWILALNYFFGKHLKKK